MPDTLKPCPFCGFHTPIAVEGDGHWYIACQGADCFCVLGEGYDPSAMPDHTFLSKPDAERAWNRRATPNT